MKDNKDFEENPVDEGKQEEGSGKKGVLTLFGHEVAKKKAIAAGLGIVCAAALVIGGVCAVNARPQAQEPEKQEQVKAESDDKVEGYVLQVGVKAEGWNKETSSPVIAHIVSETEGIDYYHAYSANEDAALDVPAKGGYEVSFITPVNADGSVYDVPDAQTVQAVEKGSDGRLPFEFTLVKADAVSKEDITGISADVADAVKGGDETLTGENGAKVAELVGKNLKANPNADTDAVDEQTEGAAESAQSGDSTAKGSGNGGSTGSAAKPSGNGSSSGNGNSNSGSGNGGNSKPSHSHNWVAQTKTVHHDAQYKTVHHDAQYQTVHHDAVTETRSICNQCGADITGNTSAHMEQSFLNGGNCVSYSTKPVVVQQAYDEQVLVRDAYDEQVLVSGAWDETVTTGYACSCGATK